MLKILGRRTSVNVMKVLWAADELGLEYQQVDVGGAFGGNDQPDYLAMNPMGLVPTLVDGDFTQWESNAIVRYLCARHGQGGLCPTDQQARATADTWMDWSVSVVGGFMRPVFWGLVRTAPADRDHADIDAGIERGKRFWAMLDAHLAGRDFIAGDRLSMGDIPLGPHLHRWMMLVEDRPAMPNLEAWYARLGEREPYVRNCMIPLQ